jgi:hypothetical protein
MNIEEDKQRQNLGEDDLTREIITRIEYNKIIGELVRKTFEKTNQSIADGKNEENLLSDSFSKVLAEHHDLFQKLIRYRIATEGIADPGKIAEVVTNDIQEKLTQSLTGLDGSTAQIYGCFFLLLLVVPLVVIWGFFPENYHWGVKLLLSGLCVGLTVFIVLKFFKRRRKKHGALSLD